MSGVSPSSAPLLVYADSRWHLGNPGLLGPHSHAVWLGSSVFDGARYFEGMAPDLIAHCERAVRSARVLGLRPMLTGAEIAELAWEGIHRAGLDSTLYIKPVFWGEDGMLVPDPASTRFSLCLFDAPMPPEDAGFTACLSSYRRPARDMAPTEAKAACLYPNVTRCVVEAHNKGFDTAVVPDPSGNVAEFAYTNLFLAKNGVVYTPVPNGTFLNGLTRQRIIGLLRQAGVEVQERSITFTDVLQADEVFSTGNYAKVQPCLRVEDRGYAIGPLYRKARELYWDFARASAGT